MAHIAFLLTIQKWNERRLFMRQAPILTRAGHKVSFMCKDPDESTPQPEGMSFVKIDPAKAGRARKFGSLNLANEVKKVNPDILVVTCMEQLPLGLYLKRTTGIGVVYDCREDQPSSVRYHKVEIPKLLRPLASKAIEKMERLGDRWFDGVIVSDPEVDKLRKRMDPDRRAIFYNVPQRSLFEKGFPPLRDRPYDLVMLGSMSVRVGVDYLIEAMGRLKQERGKVLRLLLIGRKLDFDPVLEEAVKKLVEQYGMEGQITETGYLDHDKVPDTLAQAKVGLAPQRDMLKFRRNIACKCWEYMACGMPVVASDLPPQHLILRDKENGRFYPPGDVDALMDILDELSDDWDAAAKLGEVGRAEFLDHWNTEHEAEKLEKLFERIVAHWESNK